LTPELTWKVDVRLPGKGDSNSHGARPVHLTITMLKRIRTSRLSIKNSLSKIDTEVDFQDLVLGEGHDAIGSEEGSYLRLIDLCITQL